MLGLVQQITRAEPCITLLEDVPKHLRRFLVLFASAQIVENRSRPMLLGPRSQREAFSKAEIKKTPPKTRYKGFIPETYLILYLKGYLNSAHPGWRGSRSNLHLPSSRLTSKTKLSLHLGDHHTTGVATPAHSHRIQKTGIFTPETPRPTSYKWMFGETTISCIVSIG